MPITPLGDMALQIEVGDTIDEQTHRRVQLAWRALTAAPLPGVIEVVPAYTTVTVYYDPALVVEAGAPEDAVVTWLGTRLAERLKTPPKIGKGKPRLVEVPVCYEAEFAPDLALVAKHAGLKPEEVVQLHSAQQYLVYLIGFAPGFPYLGGLPKVLETPRRAKPRMTIPPGSVGIGGAQTGIYPLATPGGWNLIGRTPLRLFRPDEDPPVLLCAGDNVKFRPIDREEFARLEATP
ncbi:MAG TPA: 5-oxoprolinase subunit PxpB [Lacunisphaera sp.]|nr:5-oxoprolinase subunit PxpB [Lacunisphaera sp.]